MGMPSPCTAPGLIEVKKESPALAEGVGAGSPGDFAKCPASFEGYGQLPPQGECFLPSRIAKQLKLEVGHQEVMQSCNISVDAKSRLHQ
jgi:hypothetical protein